MPYPNQPGNQGQIYYSGTGAPMARMPGAPGAPQPQSWLNLSALLPFLLVGGVVFFLAKKG